MVLFYIICFVIVIIIISVIQGIDKSKKEAKRNEDRLNGLKGDKTTSSQSEQSVKYCPDCFGKLNCDGNVYVCERCGTTYSEKEISKDEKIKYEADRTSDKFQMRITDIFSVPGRGTAIAGVIESGKLFTQDILKINGTTRFIMSIEFNEEIIDVATTGMNVIILVRGAQQNEFVKGAVVTKLENI